MRGSLILGPPRCDLRVIGSTGGCQSRPAAATPVDERRRGAGCREAPLRLRSRDSARHREPCECTWLLSGSGRGVRDPGGRVLGAHGQLGGSGEAESLSELAHVLDGWVRSAALDGADELVFESCASGDLDLRESVPRSDNAGDGGEPHKEAGGVLGGLMSPRRASSLGHHVHAGLTFSPPSSLASSTATLVNAGRCTPSPPLRRSRVWSPSSPTRAR